MRETIYDNIKVIINELGIKMIDIIFIMGCVMALLFIALLVVIIKQMILNKKYKIIVDEQKILVDAEEI